MANRSDWNRPPLARMRRRAGLTSIEAGAMCGKSYRTVYAWEQGLFWPMDADVTILSNAYGVTEAELRKACEQSRKRHIAHLLTYERGRASE